MITRLHLLLLAAPAAPLVMACLRMEVLGGSCNKTALQVDSWDTAQTARLVCKRKKINETEKP